MYMRQVFLQLNAIKSGLKVHVMSMVKMHCGPHTQRLAVFPTFVIYKILWNGWLCYTFMLLGCPQDKNIFWCTLFVPKPMCIKEPLLRSQKCSSSSEFHPNERM